MSTNSEVAMFERIGRLVEALEPFAKTGELFETPAYDRFTATVFAPAAGPEYAITSSHLRLAAEVYRLARQP